MSVCVGVLVRESFCSYKIVSVLLLVFFTLRVCVRLCLYEFWVHVCACMLMLSPWQVCVYSMCVPQRCSVQPFLSITQPLHQEVMVGGQASFNQGKNSISH